MRMRLGRYGMVLAALVIPVSTLAYVVPTAAADTITCVVTDVRRPPTTTSSEQDVTVTSSAGLIAITNGAIVNGYFTAPNFHTPQTSLVVTATKTDEGQATVWSFDAIDTTGFTQHCV